MNPMCSSRGQQRMLFGLAGTMTALSAVLAVTLSPWWLLLAGFVAVNQLLFSTIGACPASLILGRMCGQGTGS